MRFYHFILIILISSCSNSIKNSTTIDKIMIFTSDTTVFEDVGRGSDDLMEIFFRDSSKFSNAHPVYMKQDKLKEIIYSINSIERKASSKKNIYIPEHNFCKMWQIVFFYKNIRNCVVCINDVSNLMSINDTIFQIDRNITIKNSGLKNLLPSIISEKSKIFSSKTIYVDKN